MCDSLLLLENQKKGYCNLAAVLDTKLEHDGLWARPKPWVVMHYPHSANDTPRPSSVLRISHSPNLICGSSRTRWTVCRATRSASRLNRRIYFVRERKSSGISHHQYALLIGDDLDEKKMGTCDEKPSFGVRGVRDVVGREIIGARSGNSVSRPRVD